MKRIISALLMLTVLLAMGTIAHAGELTDEYIEEYGIPSTDENGNATILIPLYSIPVTSQTQLEIPEDHTNCMPEELALQRHFSLNSHTHQMINIRTTRTYKSLPISTWADEGFVISWTTGWSKTVTMEVSLSSGISVDQVEAGLGVNVGGSYTYTESLAYQAPAVPEGYEGRIALKVIFDYYVFDDQITYTILGVPPSTVTEVITNNTAESEPLDAVVYLELRKK